MSTFLYAETSRSRTDLKTLEVAVIRFKTMTNRLPITLQDLVRLPPEGHQGPWKPLLRAEALIDPWGEPYQYRNPGKMNPKAYDIFSKGPDKTEGTPDDIGNWQ